MEPDDIYFTNRRETLFRVYSITVTGGVSGAPIRINAGCLPMKKHLSRR